MSWFGRLKSFVEEADILADDFEAEFDNIAESFNGLFQAGRAQATAKTAFPSNGTFADIAGATKSISVEQPSILLAWATFDVSAAANTFFGTLSVDGSAQTPEAIKKALSATPAERATVSQSYAIDLSSGIHAVKMIGHQESAFGSDCSIADEQNTGFTYLVFPNPEP